MDTALNFIQFILDLGPTVMMPIIITLMGLIFRQRVSKAIRSGLTVGMGFAGIFLVIALFWMSVGRFMRRSVSARRLCPSYSLWAF